MEVEQANFVTYSIITVQLYYSFDYLKACLINHSKLGASL